MTARHAGGAHRAAPGHPAPPDGAVPGPLPVPPRVDADASVGELVGQVSRDLSTLMRQELELAKVELRQEAAETGRAGAALAGAGFVAAMVQLFTSCALWWGLAVVVAPGWAALLVALVWAAVGVPMYRSGRRRLRTVRPPRNAPSRPCATCPTPSGAGEETT